MELILVAIVGFFISFWAAITRWLVKIESFLFRRNRRPNQKQRAILEAAQRYHDNLYPSRPTSTTIITKSRDIPRPPQESKNNVEKEVARERSEVARLSSELAALKSEKASVAKELQNKTEKESALQSTVSTLLAEKAELSQKLSAKVVLPPSTLNIEKERSEVARLSSELAALKSEKESALQATVSTLLAEKAELEKKSSTKVFEMPSLLNLERHDRGILELKKQESEIQRSITELHSRRDQVAKELAAEISAEIAVEKEKALKDHHQALQSLKEKEVVVQKELAGLLEKKSQIDNSVQNLEAQYNLKRLELGNILTQQKNIDIHEEKEKTLNDLFQWMEREQTRLQSRFEEEYQNKVSSVKNDLELKIKEEFRLIDTFFSELAKEEKITVEKDVKMFLEQRLAEIIRPESQ
ncbi:MAG: hypothetical protein WCG27_06155 [Pseudomonadota bacterium]